MSDTKEPLIHIHYRAVDGEILGWETTLDPDRQPGLEIVTIPFFVPDSNLHKIDPTTKGLVNKTNQERKDASRPQITRDLVNGLIASALQASDAYMVADRPISEVLRALWTVYRQTLRDLSKLSSPEEMINAWPLAPNGEDQVARLRFIDQGSKENSDG